MANQHGAVKASVLCGVMGFTLIHRGLRRSRTRRAVQDSPRSRVASAPQGLVELEGHLWSLGPAHASFVTNGESCVWSEAVVQEYRRQGKSSRWVEVARVVRGGEFLIFDDSGAALVSTEAPFGEKAEVEVECAPRYRNWWDLRDEQRAELRGLCAANADRLPLQKGFLSPTLRVVEKVLLLGAPAYLRGNYDSGFNSGFNFGQAATTDVLGGFTRFREQVQRISRGAARVRVLDANGDGRVCESEERAGLARGGQSVANTAALNVDRYNAEPVQIYGRCGPGPHPLLLADCREEHLVARLGAYNILRVLAGVLLLGAAAYFAAREFAGDA